MKLLKYSLFVILSAFLILSVFADDINPLVYYYEDPEVTVTFSEPLSTSEARQHEIADTIAGITSNTIIDPANASPDNIICILFGHDIAPTATVTATHHKVYKYNPRCLMEVYHITYCTRCDYTVENLESSFYIVCCPED